MQTLQTAPEFADTFVNQATWVGREPTLARTDGALRALRARTGLWRAKRWTTTSNQRRTPPAASHPWSSHHRAGHRDWHERLGKGADEIAAEYDLTLADVYAALAYYFDHREEIDAAMTEDRAFAEALCARTPSLRDQKLRALRGET